MPYSARRTILVIGATGNTGRATVRTLSADLAGQDVRILGLTRTTDSAPAQELATLPLVEMNGKYWPEIDAAWLKAEGVVRAFVAVTPNDAQFTDESLFYKACLEASVEYVVRISTWAPYIGPASPIFYGRTHWALETMLEDPAYNSLQWTSLRPTVFSRQMVEPAAEAVKTYRQNGSYDGSLRLILAADLPGAWIEPDDVGKIAGKLLALADPSAHASQKYIINGPEDVTGKELVAEIERLTGSKVDDVAFNDRAFIDGFRAAGMPEKIISSLHKAVDMLQAGAALSNVEPTAQAIMDLMPPTTTVRESLLYLVGDK